LRRGTASPRRPSAAPLRAAVEIPTAGTRSAPRQATSEVRPGRGGPPGHPGRPVRPARTVTAPAPSGPARWRSWRWAASARWRTGGAEPGSGTDPPTSSAGQTAEPPEFGVLAPVDRPQGDADDIWAVLEDNPLTDGSLPALGSCDLPETPVEHSAEELQAVLDG